MVFHYQRCLPILRKIEEKLNSERLAGLLSSPRLLLWAEAFLVAFVLALNVYLRFFPAFFPQLKRQAAVNVYHNISRIAVGNADAAYQAYPPQVRAAAAEKLFQEAVKKTSIVNIKIAQEYARLKAPLQTSKGRTYLMELDPYQWLRQTEYVVKNGYPGDRRAGNDMYDSLMLYPVGYKCHYASFMFYLTAFLYRGALFFVHGLDLETFVFYVPVFYAAVFLILFYFFVRKMFGPPTAFIATGLYGLNSMVIQASSVGWYKYHILGMIMAVMVVWFLAEALVEGSGTRRTVLYTLAASFFMVLFAATWVGWWFILLASFGVYLINILNNHNLYSAEPARLKAANQPYYLSAVLFFVVSWVLGHLLLGIDIYAELIREIKSNMNLGTPLSASVWPNVYYTVSELQRLDFNSLAGHLGGRVFLITGLIGMFVIYLREKRSRLKNYVYFLLFWFAFMMFAALKGVRFTMYLALPFMIFTSAFLLKVLPQFIDTYLKGRLVRIVGTAGFLAITLFFISGRLKSGFGAAENLYPLMHSSWDKAFTFVKANTPPDAIMNSWWDYGDLFKSGAGRAVIFDGQSQRGQIAYWMGNVIIASDEDKAVRILRLLNNASDTTYDTLIKYLPDPFESVGILWKLLSVDHDQAQKILASRGIPEPDAALILKQLFAQPPPAYFVVEESMLPKMASISFLANWDFGKFYVFQNIKHPRAAVLDNLSRIFSLDKETAARIYEETAMALAGKGFYETISRRFGFPGGPQDGRRQGKLMSFANGLVIDTDSRDTLMFNQASGYVAPPTLYFYVNGTKETVRNESNYGDPAVGVLVSGDIWQSILMSRNLSDSLFFKLYFLGGQGLKHFQPFYADKAAKIYIYRIIWDLPETQNPKSEILNPKPEAQPKAETKSKAKPGPNKKPSKL